MSEKTPSNNSYDSRDEVAQLKEKLASAEANVEKQEAWGAHDVTVANEGEMNFEEYMNSRPDEGVVRDGVQFRQSQSQKFASNEDYNAALESEDDYYNRLEGGQ